MEQRKLHVIATGVQPARIK